jgi:Poly A polymerase head domain
MTSGLQFDAAERALLGLLETPLHRGPAGTFLIRDIVDLLERRGTTVYVAGGAVRDCLIGKQPHDVDLCVGGDIVSCYDSLRAAFGPGIAQGCNENFGVCRVGSADLQHVDIAMMRDIGSARGAEALLDVVWKPSASLASEASVRDFTVNALFWRRCDGFIDPGGRGLDDLAAGRLSINMHPIKAAIDHRLPLRIALFAVRGFRPDRGCLDHFRATIAGAVAAFGPALPAYLRELVDGDEFLLERIRDFCRENGATDAIADRLHYPADAPDLRPEPYVFHV